jgi:transglutaminase-like putative cysteine protease
MKALPRLLYLGCFLSLAAVAAMALDRAFSPSISSTLVRSVIAAALCAAPGLVWRRLWPLSIILLPVGCYLLMRTVVPPPSSVQGLGSQIAYYAEQLQVGASSFKGAGYPLQLVRDPGLTLFVVFSTYWIGAAAAFSALSLRRPLAGLILLLALLGFGLTVDGSARVVWISVLFAALAALLFVLCRTTTREGWRLGDAIAGGVVGVSGAFLALGLLLAAPSVAAEPWQDWRTWDPFGVGGSSYSFDRLSDYPSLLDPGRNLPVMRVDTAEPSYWRAGALDTFTGSTWETSQPFVWRLAPNEQTDGLLLYALPDTELRPTGRQVLQVFEIAAAVTTDHFFVGGNPSSLMLDRDPALRMNSMRALRTATAVGAGLRYTVSAVIPEVSPAGMVGLGRAYPLEDAQSLRLRAFYPYVELPFAHLSDVSLDTQDRGAVWRERLSEDFPDAKEWEGLYDLNQTIIGDATDPYQISLRIERYLRRFYSYTLTPPPSDFASPYAAFLFDTRRGYCQHFAGTMAVLLRFNDIPARVAVGFTAGDTDGSGAYVVTTNNAHAWVEAYFPEVGWIDFDPTPGRYLPTPGASSTSPGFTYPFLDSGDAAWTAPEQADNDMGGRLPLEDIDEEPSPQQAIAGPGLALWLPWVLGVGALFVIWPFVWSAWRQRQLHRGDARGQLRASLRLLRRDLSSYGAPISCAHTLEEALEVLRTYLGLEPDRVLVERIDAVLFGDRPATAEDVRTAEALRHEVNTRLRRRHGWVRTFSLWYGIPRISGA